MLPRVYVLGNLSIDVIVGYFNGWPEVGTEVIGDFFDFRYTGAAGNTANALRMLGFDTAVISVVGNDSFGREFINELKGKGIDTSMCRVVPERTSVSIGISMKNSERSFFTYLGSLGFMDNDFLISSIKDIKDSWIIVCGFNLIPSFQQDAFCNVVSYLTRSGNRVLFDPGWFPGGWGNKEISLVMKIAKSSAVFLPNRSEALAISRTATVDAALSYFKSEGLGGCIIKLGGDGAKGFIGEEDVSTSAYRFGEIVDTIGAGDMFNAALLRGIAEGWNYADAVSFASFYASYAITRSREERYPRFEDIHRMFLER